MIRPLKWLNGKKTTIGASLLLAGAVTREVFTGIWGIDMVLGVDLDFVAKTCDWLGGTVTTLGLGHKVKKLNGKPKEPV